MSGRRYKFKKLCCNPINLHDYDPNMKGKRQMSEYFVTKNSSFNLTKGYYICEKCRKEITKRSKELLEPPETLENEAATIPEPTDNESSSSDDTKMTEDEVFADKDTDLKLLNESLSIIGESPVKKQKIETGIYYREIKAKKIQDKICSKLQVLTPPSTSNDHLTASASHITISDGQEIVNQLKEKFNTTEKRSEKLQILTVLPKSWSRLKIQEEFKVSQYMARQAKHLVQEKGVMALPKERLPRFSKETENIIIQFYKSEEISRIMPGKKDYKSVWKGGVKVLEQKHLILCNLKEAYKLFKTKHPSIKVGFSKFAELRPCECILAGKPGTHTVCVCTIHQNIKLMIVGSGLSCCTEGEDIHLSDYNSCLAAITCNKKSVDCFFHECSECHSLLNTFAEFLEKNFEKHMIDDISYKRWISTDRATLETITKSVNEFNEEFCYNLKKLKRHDYIAKHQSQFCAEKRKTLGEGEILILADFAENYSFILQDEAQGFH